MPVDVGITLGTTVYLRTHVAHPGSHVRPWMAQVNTRAPPSGPDIDRIAALSRNYTIATRGPTPEVQGFASPMWVDANAIPRHAAVVASTVANTITIALPATALGTPASGWAFAAVLTGQDGFSPDQARAFAATPQLSPRCLPDRQPEPDLHTTRTPCQAWTS